MGLNNLNLSIFIQKNFNLSVKFFSDSFLKLAQVPLFFNFKILLTVFYT